MSLKKIEKEICLTYNYIMYYVYNLIDTKQKQVKSTINFFKWQIEDVEIENNLFQ